MTKIKNKDNVVPLKTKNEPDNSWFEKKEDFYEKCSENPFSAKRSKDISDLMNVLEESIISLRYSLMGDDLDGIEPEIDLTSLKKRDQISILNLLDDYNRYTMVVLSKFEEIMGMTPDSEMQLGLWPMELDTILMGTIENNQAAEDVGDLVVSVQERINRWKKPILFKKPTDVLGLVSQFVADEEAEGTKVF